MADEAQDRKGEVEVFANEVVSKFDCLYSRLNNLSWYELSMWNTVEQGWTRPQGTIGILSSRDFKLRDSIPQYIYRKLIAFPSLER